MKREIDDAFRFTGARPSPPVPAPFLRLVETPQTVWILLAETGYEDHARVIWRHCQPGSTVEFRTEKDHLHNPEAIAAWLRCTSLFGLLPCWKKIGYVRAIQADQWALRLDEGSLQIERAVVSNCYADGDVPRVSLQIEFRN
ncbi:MAG: hypothetical protein EOP82_15580 [Variovorax sp.]|nr:MAG: hypothetical protein EOP82_15580 [Variovorax sp.]